MPAMDVNKAKAMKTAALEELRAIPSSAYQKCFEGGEKRWHMRVITKGDQFELDIIDQILMIK